MSPDQIGVKGPISGIGFEVTQENVNEKSRSKRVLSNTKIGDPFGVLVVSVFNISVRGA